jgi:hypothetical protein
MTCDIGSPGGLGTSASSCVVFFTSDAGGVNTIRAFIDHDRNNAGASSPTYDGAEGRYSGATDCGTNAGGFGRSSTPLGPGAGETCNFDPSSGLALAAVPGTTAEPDTTDVVKKTWTQAITGNTCIDVDPNDDINPSGTEHVITATVTTAPSRTATNTSDPSGDTCSPTGVGALPRGDTIVEFSLNDGDTGIAGSDDPNAFISKINDASTGGTGGAPNNVSCTTDAQGVCKITIKTVSATATGDNFVIGRVPGSTGGSCPNTTFAGGTGGTGTGANNSCTAEVVRKNWVSPTVVARVDASPEEDTNEVNTPHSLTATATNALSTGVSGQSIIFDVTLGVNAASNLDNNTSTPGGYIGQCTTSATGSCSVSYTSAIVGDDTITACVDSNVNFNCEGAEADSGATSLGDSNDDQVLKHWVAPGAGASQIALDMEGCNGSTTSPPDANYEATATPNLVSEDLNDAHAICARVFSSNNTETRVPVTFTITSGPGRFVVPSSTNAATFQSGSATDLGSSVTVDPGTCATGAPGPGNATPATGGSGNSSGQYNCAFLLSQATGNTVVKACVQGSTTICDTGTKPWITSVQNARTVTVTPETATNVVGTDHEFTATVQDRFLNGVPGVSVTWSRSGVGVTETQETTTNAEGSVKIVISSSEEGTTTVTATISGSNTDCDEAANAPTDRPSSTAGACTDSGTKTWTAGGGTECSDGADNDGDGATDFPDDTGCSSETDDTEATPPPPCFESKTGNKVVGTPGADVLDGTGGRDRICGFGGNDVIRAMGSADLVSGGGGNDTVSAGGGADNVLGGSGEDRLSGNAGNDALRGGGFNDTLIGGGGRDRLLGGAGSDRLRGGAGNDRLDGGTGSDTCAGGTGTDTIVRCE